MSYSAERNKTRRYFLRQN